MPDQNKLTAPQIFGASNPIASPSPTPREMVAQLSPQPQPGPGGMPPTPFVDPDDADFGDPDGDDGSGEGVFGGLNQDGDSGDGADTEDDFSGGFGPGGLGGGSSLLWPTGPLADGGLGGGMGEGGQFGTPFGGPFGGPSGGSPGLPDPGLLLDIAYSPPVPFGSFGPPPGSGQVGVVNEERNIEDKPADVPVVDSFDPLVSQQWYIKNTTGGVDLNVVKAWEDYTGKGIRIAVCDDGVDYNHPDLAPNYLVGEGYNESDGTDGYPAEGQNHGTAVAGFIAAAKNGYGIQGVAYDAKIASFVDGDVEGALAPVLLRQTTFDISQNSWTLSPFVNPTTVLDSVETLAQSGRGGLGTVVVFAGSNERELEIMSTYYNTNNSPFAFSVGAVNRDGSYADFSCAGPNLLVTAPGHDVLTTDRTPPAGDDPNSYFHSGSGTSYSSPMVSGVVALMLEANPGLGYRDVQTILAATAVRTSGMTSADGKPWDWQINGAENWNGGGMHASHDYGFGLVDATAAVRLAESWDQTARTHANQQTRTGSQAPLQAIPDGSTTGATSTITIGSDIIVQQAVVTVDITHPRFDDLEITLTSPDGTYSVLLYHPSIEGIATELKMSASDYLAAKTSTFNQTDTTWSFMTVTPFGEFGLGDWVLTVKDTVLGDIGTFNGWSLTLYGDNPSNDDYYIFTDEYASLAATDPARATLTDDDGGTDTINASAVTGNSYIDLTPGAVSTIAGASLTISGTTIIENVHTGDGNDTIIGNDANNVLFGWRGNDVIFGGAGNDLISGGQGADTLTGGTGNDTFYYGSPDEGGDLITDFDYFEDLFHFAYAEFGQSGTGTLGAEYFFTSAALIDVSSACFYFESSILWFYADGTNSESAVQIAQVMGDAVQADSIVFV
ncbi:S8 family serine peptidase [Pseudodesulfovibrio pelocollis]|uniref:S8 family serine peptidase n=1 Tax=Pseudodesulfovibrio pelocollis TaxID=3051432 RepID=UPI00255B347B|nr:S8 family serine peptidase [Pseudodesulfovibrio sp. SB368]